MRDRLGEAFSDHADDEFQLAPFALREMIQAVIHRRTLAAAAGNAKAIYSAASADVTIKLLGASVRTSRLDVGR